MAGAMAASSVATMNQLGRVLQAAWVTGVAKAAMALGADEAESVGLFLDHEGRGDAEALILVPGRLADIGGQGGDIDQALHLFVDAGLGDHHAAPRVAAKNGSAVLA